MNGGIGMPFKLFDVEKHLQSELNSDPEFNRIWMNSRLENFCKSELVRLRTEKGWTQKDIADKINVSQQFISKIEKMNSTVSLKVFCLMISILGYSIEFIPKENYNVQVPQNGVNKPEKEL
jgi:DNA-binding XRE family transcriptional regulator